MERDKKKSKKPILTQREVRLDQYNDVRSKMKCCYFFVHGTVSLFFIFFFSACVSISLDSLKDQKAKGVVFTPPVKPYEKTVKKGMDFAWENSENGHILAFFSNCSPTDRFTSLKHFRKELLDGLKSFHIRDEKEVYHQGQKAYRLSLTQISSVPRAMSMNLFLFKKGDCLYALNFLYRAGQEWANSKLRSLLERNLQKPQDSNKVSIMPSSEKRTTDHQSVFEDFIKGFRAP